MESSFGNVPSTDCNNNMKESDQLPGRWVAAELDRGELIQLQVSFCCSRLKLHSCTEIESENTGLRLSYTWIQTLTQSVSVLQSTKSSHFTGFITCFLLSELHENTKRKNTRSDFCSDFEVKRFHWHRSGFLEVWKITRTRWNRILPRLPFICLSRAVMWSQ